VSKADSFAGSRPEKKEVRLRKSGATCEREQQVELKLVASSQDLESFLLDLDQALTWLGVLGIQPIKHGSIDIERFFAPFWSTEWLER
jgi:hypothetical protein